MSRLNVVSAEADRELDAIRAAIDSFELAAGLEDMLEILRARANRGDRIELLDAIGHSFAQGFLNLGTWIIDDSFQTAASFSELLRPSFQELGIRTVRLLGCSTATTERGRHALRRIARATGCQVLGTKRYVSRRDYGPAGFISDDTLVDVSQPSSFIRRRSETRDQNA